MVPSLGTTRFLHTKKGRAGFSDNPKTALRVHQVQEFSDTLKGGGFGAPGNPHPILSVPKSLSRRGSDEILRIGPGHPALGGDGSDTLGGLMGFIKHPVRGAQVCRIYRPALGITGGPVCPVHGVNGSSYGGNGFGARG